MLLLRGGSKAEESHIMKGEFLVGELSLASPPLRDLGFASQGVANLWVLSVRLARLALDDANSVTGGGLELCKRDSTDTLRCTSPPVRRGDVIIFSKACCAKRRNTYLATLAP
eukprot:357329-Amphidinium_carterae.1